ncbi:GNAT family acetyltransferase [Sphingopyxis indica]|uniref:GNAT family acetyltransferase n=1 Tax=Sphingopyxis indica TaxID=436663 RepID=UPI0029393FC4|nr:GNAT family acetyltransferase [Sphingopyxis indica]WOF44698.1 GNAT family acetyltransferase [Sphingopyxis indica]
MTAIRPARASDGAAVVALWRACDLTRPWNDPQADFDRALGHAAATVLVAEQGSAIAGTVMAGFDGHRGWIYYLGVAPARRGEGLARRLLDAACDWLRGQGCPKVELMVRDGNDAATLYRHLGWEPQGVQVFGRWLAR